ncbi:restriction endonuclease subunit S [Bombilactobacillus mellis]|uniref:restriction endonuclease subunit S n=1 Tax=Bombilactobacillus mellis TaxID=1218508 RepID=UPI00224789DA|nr:restriction endonuclease subunit S [Bombilactobacillus mellis]MCX0278456.1 restriction endonuclease subunit S [Bombilactobacillus mellis]
MKYKITKLKDIAEISMGQSPSSKYYNKTKKGIPFLQGVSTFGEMFPQINTYTTVYRKEAKSGDILFSVRAPVGKVNFANQKTAIGRGLATIRVKKTYSKFYIYYFFKKNGRLLDFLSSGTVFTSINKKDLEEIRLKIPNRLNDQQQIAEKLLKIDKKIDINNQINDNLMELKTTIFNKMFSINLINCLNGKIKDIAEVRTGKRPKIKYSKKGSTPIYPIIGASKIMGYTDEYLVA